MCLDEGVETPFSLSLSLSLSQIERSQQHSLAPSRCDTVNWSGCHLTWKINHKYVCVSRTRNIRKLVESKNRKESSDENVIVLMYMRTYTSESTCNTYV